MHRSAPVFTAPAFRTAPVLGGEITLIDLEGMDIYVPPLQTPDELEDGFRSHWAHRPAPRYAPLKQSARGATPNEPVPYCPHFARLTQR